MKKRNIYFLLGIIIVISAIYLYYNGSKTLIYEVKGDKIYYSLDKTNIKYDSFFSHINDSYELYNITFLSRDFLDQKSRIYGLLLMPIGKNNVPGVILLPAGQGTKESRMNIAEIIVKAGYSVLVIDQRGIGETTAPFIDYQEDFKIFMQGKETMHHLAVYDVIASKNVLSQIKNIDKKNVVVVGESMGARYGIIATAIDKNIKGVIVISSSGFNAKNDKSNQARYYLTIDPDNYIADISPRKIYFFHGRNDSVVTLQDARNSYNKAKEPKKFKVFTQCLHGYCPQMEEDLKNSLKEMFEQ